MVTVWKDAKSFRRHLEAMKTFRQSHSTFPSNEGLVSEMPTPYVIDLSHGERLITYLTTSVGKLIFLPLWKVAAPPGSQN
jgi:hypothetical protein